MAAVSAVADVSVKVPPTRLSHRTKCVPTRCSGQTVGLSAVTVAFPAGSPGSGIVTAWATEAKSSVPRVAAAAPTSTRRAADPILMGFSLGNRAFRRLMLLVHQGKDDCCYR